MTNGVCYACPDEIVWRQSVTYPQLRVPLWPVGRSLTAEPGGNHSA